MAPKKSDHGGSIDRLSTLPDSVLCHIQSFLPTITSVATMSLVSRRWRHLWKYLQVFHFDDSDFRCKKKFALFVNAVLALRKSRDIRNFHLTLCYLDVAVDYIDMWLHAAVGPRLQELSFTITESDVYLPPSFLMNCPNLISLSLHGDVYINERSSVHFPSLKKLDLNSNFWNSEIPFLSGCPKLETLDTFFSDIDLMVKVFSQASSSSKSLKSTNYNFTWANIEIYGGSVNLGIISYFQSMVEAFLHGFLSCESEFIDPILKKLQEIEICLLSRHSTSKCPLHAPVLNYPEFRNLHHLKFILPFFNLNLLLNVLEKCHMLQVLIIHSNKEEPSPPRTWEPHSTTIPKCLKSHLTYIHIEGYQGFEYELTFAEYILRNGLVLETMLIFVDISMDIMNKYRSIRRLTNISKGSVKCQLKFDPDGSH